MEDLNILAVSALAIVAGIGFFYFRRSRPTPAPILKLNAREERLAKQLARSVSYPVPDVLPSIRVELDLAPHLPDDVLLKRAKYHFQQNQPEKQCSVWIDRKVG